MEGIEKGDVCNRNGCEGIIAEHDKEGSCSCHIHPPCGYCTTETAYCPVCNWDAKEQQRESEASRPVYKHTEYKHKTFDDLDKTKIDWICESHTHFSMIKRGVYPEGTEMSDVAKLVKGTFGGRFSYFYNGDFKYIAYTD